MTTFQLPPDLIAIAQAEIAELQARIRALERVLAVYAADAQGAATHARSAPPRQRRGRWITPERLDVLRDMYPDGVPMQDIHRVLSAMPGPDLPFPKVIQVFASGALRLQRPRTKASREDHGPANPQERSR